MPLSFSCYDMRLLAGRGGIRRARPARARTERFLPGSLADVRPLARRRDAGLLRHERVHERRRSRRRSSIRSTASTRSRRLPRGRPFRRASTCASRTRIWSGRRIPGRASTRPCRRRRSRRRSSTRTRSRATRCLTPATRSSSSWRRAFARSCRPRPRPRWRLPPAGRRPSTPSATSTSRRGARRRRRSCRSAPGSSTATWRRARRRRWRAESRCRSGNPQRALHGHGRLGRDVRRLRPAGVHDGDEPVVRVPDLQAHVRGVPLPDARLHLGVHADGRLRARTDRPAAGRAEARGLDVAGHRSCTDQSRISGRRCRRPRVRTAS